VTRGTAASGRFPRSARLKRRRLIQPLFDRSRTDVHSTAAGAVRVVFRLAPRTDVGLDIPVQVGFAVSSRVRKATERNRIKRHMRVGYQSDTNRYTVDIVPRDRTLTMMAIYRADRFSSDTADDAGRAFDRVASALASDTRSG